MILRSVMKHVRDQNWLAVGIDFLIVVVGVFIGIQVANWNEVRQEHAVERVLLERIQRDFEQILVLDQERYVRTISAPDDLGRLIGMLRDDVEARPEMVWPGVHAALITYAQTPSSPTYDELLSTGRLSRLTNELLRQQLAEFERSRSNEEGVTEYVMHQSLGSPVYAHVSIDTVLPQFDVTGSYDWQGLKDTLPYLQERLIYVHALANWRRSSHEIAQQILVQLEEELQ